MAYIVRHVKSTNKYDTSTAGSYDNVSETDSNTISTMKEFDYYVGVPRRCSRCRMYDWEGLRCKKDKDSDECRKSYSIKKKK